MLSVMGGYWYVRDLKSRNGIRVNGVRVFERRLDPGDELTVAQHRYEVKYSPTEIGAIGPPPATVPESEIFSKSLLQRAGLEKSRPMIDPDAPTPDPDELPR
jgi:adenylate cyclase